MEAPGLRTVLIDQDPAEEVLAGVLLHEIPASSPVDAPLDLRADLERLIGHMEDHTDLFKDLEYFSLAESPFIAGLTAPFRIEGGAVEDDPPGLLPDFADVENRRREGIEEGIFPEELLSTRLFSRHSATCTGSGQKRNSYVAFSIRVRLVAVGSNVSPVS